MNPINYRSLAIKGETMLKEMREQDPTLSKFRAALSAPRYDGRPYSPMTVKSYQWHAKNFIDYCDEANTSPRKISKDKLKKYFVSIDREVKANKKSYPFFLQACTSLEILFRTVIKNDKMAREIPRLRKKITA